MQKIVATYPLVGEGITIYEIAEWKTTVRVPGLDALLGDIGAPIG